MSRVDVCLQRETANDEFAVVVKIYEDPFIVVQEGQHIFDIENSKATQEVIAPATGILLHVLNVGDEIDFGVSIAAIVSPDEVTSTTPPDPRISSNSPPIRFPSNLATAPNAPPVTAVVPSKRGLYPPRPPDRPPKFSRAARDLMSGTNIDPASFSMEWVTADDLRQHFGRTSSSNVSGPETTAQPPETGGPKRLSMHKRAEIQSLSTGAGASMLSVLGVSLGKISVHRKTGDVFDNRITDLVIYESSRLMARYSNLNSYFSDGFVKKHESVVAGLAIDEGGRLAVYGIENAMRLGLSDVRSEILNAVSRYMEHALTDREMSRATFTVTDLSAEPLDFIFPLLPEKQSCIIGITRDAHGEFRLYVGFDHRVTEGREVTLFLGELRSRLQSFDTGIRASNTRCCFCEKSLAEEVHSLKNRGLIKVLNAEGNEVYCCLACLGGG